MDSQKDRSVARREAQCAARVLYSPVHTAEAETAPGPGCIRMSGDKLAMIRRV